MAVKLPENKIKPESLIKVEPKEDELATPTSDKLKRLLANSAFGMNLHKPRVLPGVYPPLPPSPFLPTPGD
jgi:hypothetical protein